MKYIFRAVCLVAVLLWAVPRCSQAIADDALISKETKTCITCHKKVTPGIVADWAGGAHAHTTPQTAMGKTGTARMMSSNDVPETLRGVSVGCYECHALNASAHKDNFKHYSFQVNVIVSPPDCAVCHKDEAAQYSGTKKASALGNLRDNPVYLKLVETLTGMASIQNGHPVAGPSSDATKANACYGCHGTEVTVTGTRTVTSSLGEVTVPELTNWPNHGVGRINPDGSAGSCTACHPRHSFSMEIARRPETCSQCHLEPDVPAWNVYRSSKHGNIYQGREKSWNWTAVPWTVGDDFTAPTCAACHNSLLARPGGEIVAERTHNFGDRLYVRLFGLIYATPQPENGATYLIRNKDGLPLPATFANEPAVDFLISPQDQRARADKMKAVCRSCHNSQYVDNHFARLDTIVAETNAMTLTSTQLMAGAWDKGLADKANPFDEALELSWVRQWLFYSNSIRYSAAMLGPSYAAFEHGWWDLTENLQQMADEIAAKSEK